MREEAGGTILQMMHDISTKSFDQFQAYVLAMKAEHERWYSFLTGMEVGWTPSRRLLTQNLAAPDS